MDFPTRCGDLHSTKCKTMVPRKIICFGLAYTFPQLELYWKFIGNIGIKCVWKFYTMWYNTKNFYLASMEWNLKAFFGKSYKKYEKSNLTVKLLLNIKIKNYSNQEIFI